MVNVGLNFSSVLGLLQILIALVYFALSISQIVIAIRLRRDTDLVFRIIQLILAPLMLSLSGFILFFQGWRLDPILLFQQLLMNILLVFHILIYFKRSSNITQ
jgi:hypothetical protein